MEMETELVYVLKYPVQNKDKMIESLTMTPPKVRGSDMANLCAGIAGYVQHAYIKAMRENNPSDATKGEEDAIKSEEDATNQRKAQEKQEELQKKENEEQKNERILADAKVFVSIGTIADPEFGANLISFLLKLNQRSSGVIADLDVPLSNAVLNSMYWNDLMNIAAIYVSNFLTF